MFFPKSPLTKSTKYTLSLDQRFFTQSICIQHQPPSKNIIPRYIGKRLNILHLHKNIQKRLKKTKTNDKEILEKISIQKWILETSSNQTEIRIAKDSIFELEQKLGKLDSRTEYENFAKPLLQEYKNLFEKKHILNLKDMVLKKQNISRDAVRLEKTFMNHAQKYVNIQSISFEHIEDNCCDKQNITSEGDNMVCMGCGKIYVDIESDVAYKDSKRVAPKKSVNYNSFKHFKDTRKQIHGLQQKQIPQMVFEWIEKYCKRRKLQKEKITIYDLDKILSSNKNLKEYYRDIHLIYRIQTQKQLLDISDVADDIDKMYLQQEAISDLFKLNEDSKNSVNASYMNCRLAQLCGRTDLRVEMFFCTKTKKTMKLYDILLEKKARHLKWIDESQDIGDIFL